MKTDDIFGAIPRQMRDYSKPAADSNAAKVFDSGRWTTANGETIVCGSLVAFEELRKQFFPHIPVSLWIKQND